MKVLISALPAVSIMNQADLIKKLLESKGFDVEYKRTISVYDIRNDEIYGFLWVTLATVPFLGDAVYPYLEAKSRGTKQVAIYVTIEGIPTRANVYMSNIPKLEVIANSKFTYECLYKGGYRVVGWIHHAIDWDFCQKMSSTADYLRKRFDKEYGDKCRLIYVGRYDPRKALPKLAQAVKYLNEKGRDDFVLLLVTDRKAMELFGGDEPYPNVVFHAPTGSMPYGALLQTISACHYLVFPTVCEGFGLPVLEANALGIPAIHCWFPPLNEFSSKDFNFVWDFLEEKLVPEHGTKLWVFHEYPWEWLADMMEYAIDTYHKSKEEYQNYCEKAKEHAKNWDYRKIYSKLLNHLGVK